LLQIQKLISNSVNLKLFSQLSPFPAKPRRQFPLQRGFAARARANKKKRRIAESIHPLFPRRVSAGRSGQRSPAQNVHTG